MTTKAVILVGGDTRGTRFRPISLSVPKVLFPAGGKPLLEHAVEAVVAQGVSEILLIGFYENSIFDYFIGEINRTHPDTTIKYLREYKAMGTAGGLYHFRDQILRGKTDRFYVIHADVCSSYPLAELDKMYTDTRAEAVILGTRVPKGISANFGAIIQDEHNKVLHYVEKPEESVSTLVNGGIYLMSVGVFDVIAAAKAQHELNQNFGDVDDDEDLLQIERDVLPVLADKQVLYVYTTTSFWRQVKEAGSALVANQLYLDDEMKKHPDALASGDLIRPPVFIHPLAIVDKTAVIGPNVTIGPHVKVGAGARVRDAVLLRHCQLRDNAVVINAVLCPGVRVGRWARVEGSQVGVNDYLSYVVKDGIKVPRVSILAKDVVVADEVHLQNSIVLPHKDIRSDVKNEIVM